MCKKVKIGKAAVVATAKPLGLLLCSSTPSFSTPYFFEWSRNGWDKEASSEKNTKIFLNLFQLSKIFLKLLNCYHIVNCLIKHNSWQRFEKIFKKQKRFYKPYFFSKKIVSLEFPKCFCRHLTLDSYLVHFLHLGDDEQMDYCNEFLLCREPLSEKRILLGTLLMIISCLSLSPPNAKPLAAHAGWPSFLANHNSLKSFCFFRWMW